MSRVSTLVDEPEPAEQRRKYSTATTATYVGSRMSRTWTRSKTKSVSSSKDVRGSVEKVPSHEDGEPSGRKWYHPLRLLMLFIKNWFLIGMAVLITLAWRFPNVGREGGGELLFESGAVVQANSSHTLRIHCVYYIDLEGRIACTDPRSTTVPSLSYS